MSWMLSSATCDGDGVGVVLAAVGVEKLQVVVCSLSQWSCQCRVGRCSTAEVGGC